MTNRCVCAAIIGLAAVMPAAAADKPALQQRWFYAAYNLLVQQGADDVIALLHRAGRSGYNGMVLADYKFNILERLPKRYFDNVAKVRKAAAAAGIEIIPAVCSIGYSSGLLAHDPNLAEGLPVKGAPFVAHQGTLAPVADPACTIRNGTLEQTKGALFTGYAFQDRPGVSSFADRQVKHQGRVSCRMEIDGNKQAGMCRLAQRVHVRPYACYRLSCWLKTQDLQPAAFRLLALGDKGRVLSYFDDAVKPTQDWTHVSVVFNSLTDGDITVYAGIWEGRSGTLWFDDFQIEELFLVNPLRRAGCPIALTSADGHTIYEEGRDYEPIRDAKLGMDPWAGEYNFRHAGVVPRLTANSRIHDGEKVLVSWYHPLLTHSYQVMCCLTEPKVYEVMKDQVERVNKLLRPRTFFLSHDEIRVANWCQLCQKANKTPGALLADNVRRCVQLIAQVNPSAEVVVWSDMFDPHHNAVADYYLVNGTLAGSWEGLPARVHIANWNAGKAAQSLKWFAGRGHEQIMAGFYDEGMDNFKRWQAAARNVPNVRGFMYTTWQNNYELLEAYGKAMTAKR